jgi:hypothetical protein
MEHISKNEATPEEIISLGETMREFRSGDIYAALKINADVSIRIKLSSSEVTHSSDYELGYLRGIQYLEDSINGMIVSGEQVKINLDRETEQGVEGGNPPLRVPISPKKRRG